MSKTFSYLKKYKKELILGPLFKILEAIFELIIPFIVAFVIDEGIKTKDSIFVMSYGFLIVGLGVLGLLSTMVCQYFASKASQGFGTLLRNAIYKKIFNINKEDLEKFGKANIQTLITNDVNQMQVVVAMIIRLVIRAPFLVIGALICSFIIDVEIGLIFLGVTVLIAIVLLVFVFVTSKKYIKVQESIDEVSLKTSDALEGTRVIRAFNKQEETTTQYEETLNKRTKNVLAVDVINALINPIIFAIVNFAIILIIYFGGYKIEINNLKSGDVIALINYLNQILVALVVVVNLVVIFTKGFASKNRIEKFLTVKEIDNNGQIKDKQINPGESLIEFKNVSFSFEEDETHNVLSNISFDLKKGESLGIVGGTASGKTTIINLVERFYSPKSGEIIYKGEDINNFELKNFRDEISYVTQKASLINDTIEENITFNAENYEESELLNSLEMASALNFVNEKDQKLKEIIFEGGKNFSGGQKQRLSIARALFKKSELLILDDSFSALDFLTEKKIKSNIKKMVKENNLTTILVSQRINSIKDCSNILVLDHGRVQGYGTHEYLLKTCELYKEIYYSQERNN